MTDPAIELAWRYGRGLETLNIDDSNMVDAAILLRQDLNGNSIWHPTLTDLDIISFRTFSMYLQMSDGMARRSNPYEFMLDPDGYTHHVEVGFESKPSPMTRCNRPVGHDWRQVPKTDDVCRTCSAEHTGRTGLRIKRSS